jgi:putative transposase
MSYLTTKSNLKLNKLYFSIIDELSFRVKNLYNSALYEIYNHYDSYKQYLNYNAMDKKMKNHESNFSYRKLNAQMSQQTLKKLDKNYSSFFSLLKKKGNNDYDKPIDKPKFLPKDGRKELIFSRDLFRIKDDKILLSVPKDIQLEYKIKFLEFKLPNYIKDKEIKYIEIIPSIGSYSMSIVYNNNLEITPNLSKDWISIDLGINNLCSITSNKFVPVLLNGKPIKSINQKFNKRIASCQKKLKANNKKSSKKIRSLYSKRGDKLHSEMHKISSFIVDLVKDQNIGTVVVGYNKEWKQRCSLGKKNNQKFVQIPYMKLINQLQYKLLEQEIELIIQEESYTSKCSFMDKEPCCKQQTYKGNREKRGLFITSKGVKINADVNGSLNIFKKAIKNLEQVVQDELISIPLNTGLVMNPLKVTLRTDLSQINQRSILLKIKINTPIVY